MKIRKMLKTILMLFLITNAYCFESHEYVKVAIIHNARNGVGLN